MEIGIIMHRAVRLSVEFTFTNLMDSIQIYELCVNMQDWNLQ